jgi:hypothetical protein
MSKKHFIIKYFLEQRYQQNILNEALDDGGNDSFSYNKLRKAKGPRPEDLLNIYADAAYDTVPGVKGMAQAEVPFAKKDPVAYDKARSIFAKALVDARKEAFDDRQKLIANGIADPIKVDETEILKKALAKKPELAQILTRDEYESLAGDITNPLELNVSVKDEKTGNEYSKLPITMDKWGGIDDNHAALYGFLRGAQDSLTTPEGLAMAAAGGAAFKIAGSLAGSAGRAAAPTVAKYGAKYLPAFLKNTGKFIPGAIGRARDVGEVGSAAGEYAVNAAGLGALGYGAYQANEAGQLSKYAGQLAGGVAPFAFGRGTAGLGIKAAPAVYAKGQEVAGDIGVVAKGTADSAIQAGKNVAGAVSSAGRAIADTSLSDIPGNIRTGIKELIPDPRYQIRKGPYQKNRNFEIDNLEPVDPTIPERRSIYDTSGQREPSIYSNVDSNGNLVVEPQSPLYQTSASNSTVTSKPTSSSKQRAAVTAMAALAARNGVSTTNIDISKPSSSMSSVETAPRENLGDVEMRPPTVPEAKPVLSSNNTPSSSSNTQVSGNQLSTSISGTIPTNSNVVAKPFTTTTDNTKQTAKNYSNNWWKSLQGTKVPATGKATAKQNQIQNQIQNTNFNTNTSNGGGSIPGMNIVTLPPTPPPPPTPIIPPLLPIGGIGVGSGGGNGKYDDDDQLRMKGGDISAMLQNLYQNARTIRLR